MSTDKKNRISKSLTCSNHDDPGKERGCASNPFPHWTIKYIYAFSKNENKKTLQNSLSMNTLMTLRSLFTIPIRKTYTSLKAVNAHENLFFTWKSLMTKTNHFNLFCMNKFYDQNKLLWLEAWPSEGTIYRFHHICVKGKSTKSLKSGRLLWLFLRRMRTPLLKMCPTFSTLSLQS